MFNQKEALQILLACKPVADKLANSGQGIYTELNEQEKAVLDGFAALIEADLTEGEWDALRRRAGLLPSDMGLLQGALWQRTIKADPQGVLAEVKAFFLNKRKPSALN